MKDIDTMPIEKIILLPFFHSLEKYRPDAKKGETSVIWKITFRCNRIIAEGMYSLLDYESESEYVVRYKNIEFVK